MNQKPNVCRVASLLGFNGVLLGRDLGGILTPGNVYEIRSIAGVLTINDLGPHATGETFEGGTISQHAVDGTHCLTKKEYKPE